MQRREFITVLGGAAAAWPLTARAQQLGNRHTIGWLTASGPSNLVDETRAFMDALGALGWVEGKNVTFEKRTRTVD